jgi:hypothetical protein
MDLYPESWTFIAGFTWTWVIVSSAEEAQQLGKSLRRSEEAHHSKAN